MERRKEKEKRNKKQPNGKIRKPPSKKKQIYQELGPIVPGITTDSPQGWAVCISIAPG
jgi:hypothetical protein